MVLMEAPPQGVNSKPQVTEYCVKTLERVLGSEKDAQMCVYDASWDTHFGFCCDSDEETSRELAGLPGVLSVRPDPDYSSVKKDYSFSSIQSSYLSSSQIGSNLFFPVGSTKNWLVRMDKLGIGVVTKAQMVDYYAQILTKVLGNEKDAQMCIYHVSWQSNFGFCCELDDECAQELAGVPGVLSVQLDKNFESENKNYGGNNLQSNLQSSTDLPDPSEASQTIPIKTKKLFVTGLSFYTSEKTLRAAFEGFGELVEVKIIMDKISKRSKGYAFIEYTTEEAASAALKEMNGKVSFLLSFYTSEKTLRAAFEGFGELVEVKIIMDKISKRSKGYAFIEYTTEEAASAALKEMNGKIINGWMIVVDVAKTNPPRYSRGRPR
nr:multiple organellar rna editing factor 5, mitochondrial [Quercus suber]